MAPCTTACAAAVVRAGRYFARTLNGRGIDHGEGDRGGEGYEPTASAALTDPGRKATGPTRSTAALPSDRGLRFEPTGEPECPVKQTDPQRTSLNHIGWWPVALNADVGFMHPSRPDVRELSEGVQHG